MSFLRLPMLLALFVIALCLGGSYATPVADPGTLERRVSALIMGTVGLGNNVSQSLDGLANAVSTGGNPAPWIQDIDKELEAQVTVNAQIAPGDKADPQDDIIDLTVQIVLEIVLGVSAVPLDLGLVALEPALDTAMSQWLLSMGSEIASAAGQAYPPDSYVHLLTLNLELTISVLGLVNVIGKIL